MICSDDVKADTLGKTSVIFSSHQYTLSIIYSMHLTYLLNASICRVLTGLVLLAYSIPRIIIRAEGASEKLET